MPKSIETRSKCSMHAQRQGMIVCNNHNMRNPISLHLKGVNKLMHVMIVACYHPLPLSACMLHFDLVSILFGTSIPTSFNILVKMFLHLYIYYTAGLLYLDPHKPNQWKCRRTSSLIMMMPLLIGSMILSQTTILPFLLLFPWLENPLCSLLTSI